MRVRISKVDNTSPTNPEDYNNVPVKHGEDAIGFTRDAKIENGYVTVDMEFLFVTLASHHCGFPKEVLL